jgi:gamma-glutamylcyclotransferase (GGCT)/AIG2-like uncharacterized protein YtfP
MPFLFVYGTLRRAVAHPMHSLIAKHARWVGEATVGGTLLDLGDYPALVRSANPADWVSGEVYEVPDATTLFPLLDDYEDVWPDDPVRSLYRRELHPVRLTSGEVITAWLYVYNRPAEGWPRVASGDWLEK